MKFLKLFLRPIISIKGVKCEISEDYFKFLQKS